MESSGGSETSLSRRGCDNAPTRKDRRVGLIYDERMCGHYATEDGDHPECPDRIRAIWKSLESCGFAKRCVVLDAKNAEDNHIALVHSRNHINLIKNTISKSTQSGRRRIASSYNSIYFSKGSSEAAYLAAGSVIEVAEKVAEGQLDSSFAIVRPPGHHAEVDEPMGFCLYNNVAIAASFLLNERKDLGINKILIVDWDVHHGNGTQKMFYSDPRVLFFSVHRHDFGTFYPTGDNGSYIMIGEGPGVGYNINVPWENGRCGDVDYLAVWDHILIPIAKEFNPDIILISAGFDAAIRDPLGGCRVTPYGYSIMLEKLMPFARGKIVMALEGGYNLDSIANSVQACVGVLLGDSPIAGSPQSYPFESTWRVIHQVRQELRAHWPIIASKLPNKVFSKPSPQMDASERGFVGPHSAAAESVARTRIRPGPPPLAPVLLAPSEATAVLHQIPSSDSDGEPENGTATILDVVQTLEDIIKPFSSLKVDEDSQELQKVYIWYAAFGSNMSMARFLCYIEGGQTEGMKRPCVGSMDRSKPVEIMWKTYPHRLFFGRDYTSTWGPGGVAFLHPESNSNEKAYLCLYKITLEQFNDVLLQENGSSHHSSHPTFDMTALDRIKSETSISVETPKRGWYHNVVYLGLEKDIPVLTMTCSLSDIESFKSGTLPIKPPCKEYGNTLIKGLAEGKHLSEEEASAYIEEAYTKPL
ncbi:histone deacetylase 5 isoform X2 [Andrographis paniculata]|uniref:histone deacetylase 5 isoform X2 n=1 Tax=Andrographis paniculata TaxID=175694 RepID=UPI0021E840FD|nr:histone deacetylase 5 isoform X2 [Andrographis paniculata]